MSPFLRFLIYRLVSIPVTLLVVTALLYGIIMLTPPESRAWLYLPKKQQEAPREHMLKLIIERYHLDEPYPIQYGLWLGRLVQGEWGYSPTMQNDVLSALLQRTPATAELTLYSLLLFIPFGLVSGVLAGWRRGRLVDRQFRLLAFIATSLPPFILSILLMGIFYVGLRWFPPERLSLENAYAITKPDFQSYTGLVTVDGLLNRRPDIALDALRHLVLPVFTLSLLHWATLGRVTRATLIEELRKEYVMAAKARGIGERSLIWHHAFRNSLAPALTTSTLSAAALVTGVYVVEIIYNFHGVSELMIESMARNFPDATAAMGFAIYSVLVVLVLMVILDVVQAAFDPRLREGILSE